MNDYYVDMFKIPFLHLQVRDWEYKKQKLKSLFDSSGFWNSDADEMTSDYHYKVDTGNVEKHNKEIDEILSEEIKIFLDFFKFIDHKIIITWFQTTVKGQHHPVHNHGSSGYTAVCYIDYDDTIHQPTQFLAPFNHFIRGDSLYYNPEDIKEGSIVFFPSVINHYAPPNFTDVPRTILSINFKLRSSSHNRTDEIFEKLR